MSDSDSDADNIMGWRFGESDTDDETFAGSELVESEDEPYPGILHGIDRFEVRGLAEDVQQPPRYLDDPEAALDSPSDEDSSEHEQRSVADDDEAEAPELSDIDLGREDIPEEPPLAIDPDDAEVSPTTIQCRCVDIHIPFSLNYFRTSLKLGGWPTSSRNSLMKIRQANVHRGPATRFARRSRIEPASVYLPRAGGDDRRLQLG